MKSAIKPLLRPVALAGVPDALTTSVIRATLTSIQDDGLIQVTDTSGQTLVCEWLETPLNASTELRPGDVVLVAPGAQQQSGVVLGRVARYRAAVPEKNISVEASETLSLKCGESSIELRADGKLMVKGEDVLVKARGTQRIKAGTVNIN
jgi:hypothetical protein